MKLVLTVVLAAAAVAGCASTPLPGPRAEAALSPTAGAGVSGRVSFIQKGELLTVDAQVEGLTPGLHGFHIHEKGDCSAPDGTSAGGHFNPSGMPHGDPAHAGHHGGDFGNLVADANGVAHLHLSVPTTQASLNASAANNIVGRGLIVHADRDDFMTQPTGNSGKRLACGVIVAK